MRHLVNRLALAGVVVGVVAGAAVALPLAAPASASSFTCASILGGDGLVATVCTDIVGGQVRGRLTPFAAGLEVDSLILAKCDAPGTSCTTLAQTTALMTPTFPAKSGKYYETCAFVHVRESPTVVRNYTGCSPFAVAP
jgi:hypothetical protein